MARRFGERDLSESFQLNQRGTHGSHVSSLRAKTTAERLPPSFRFFFAAAGRTR